MSRKKNGEKEEIIKMAVALMRDIKKGKKVRNKN